MKKPLFSLLLAAFLLLLNSSSGQARVSFNFFFDTLEPYGEWVDVGDYGYCWRPVGVERDWRPYSDGYWTYTDAGWTWVSYEDWGGITYHYGRWVYIEEEGWCWVPGYEWGPAWVSWRYSDDYVGWAPLPPEVRFRSEVGISVWVDRTYDIGPSHYNFCRVRNFGAPVMRGVLVDRHENVTIINQTVNITNITVNRTRNVVYNGGPDYDRVCSRAERRIPALKLVKKTDLDVSDYGQRGGGEKRRRALASELKGDALVVTAPEVQAPVEKVQPPKPAKMIRNARVDKGWAEIKDQKLRHQLKEHMEKETAGLSPENAPAKPVEVGSVVTKPLLLPAGPESQAATPNQPAEVKRDKPRDPGVVQQETLQPSPQQTAPEPKTELPEKQRRNRADKEAQSAEHQHETQVPFGVTSEAEKRTEEPKTSSAAEAPTPQQTDVVEKPKVDHVDAQPSSLDGREHQKTRPRDLNGDHPVSTPNTDSVAQEPTGPRIEQHEPAQLQRHESQRPQANQGHRVLVPQAPERTRSLGEGEAPAEPAQVRPSQEEHSPEAVQRHNRSAHSMGLQRRAAVQQPITENEFGRPPERSFESSGRQAAESERFESRRALRQREQFEQSRQNREPTAVEQMRPPEPERHSAPQRPERMERQMPNLPQHPREDVHDQRINIQQLQQMGRRGGNELEKKLRAASKEEKEQQ